MHYTQGQYIHTHAICTYMVHVLICMWLFMSHAFCYYEDAWKSRHKHSTLLGIIIQDLHTRGHSFTGNVCMAHIIAHVIYVAHMFMAHTSMANLSLANGTHIHGKPLTSKWHTHPWQPIEYVLVDSYLFSLRAILVPATQGFYLRGGEAPPQTV